MLHFLSGLVDATLNGEAPQKIAVLGDTGAGKSTFVEQCKYLLGQQRIEDDREFRHAVGKWQETNIQRRRARSSTPELVTLTTSSCDFPVHCNPVLAKQSTMRPTVGLNVAKVSLSSTRRIGTRQPPPQQLVPLVLPGPKKGKRSATKRRAPSLAASGTNSPPFAAAGASTTSNSPISASAHRQESLPRTVRSAEDGDERDGSAIQRGGGEGRGYPSPPTLGTPQSISGGISRLKAASSFDTVHNGSLIDVSATTPTSQESESGTVNIPLQGSAPDSRAVASSTQDWGHINARMHGRDKIAPANDAVNCRDIDVWGDFCRNHLITDMGPPEQILVEQPLLMWDLGGQEHLRALWVNYLKQCDGVVFVVDGRIRRVPGPTALPPMSSTTSTRENGVPSSSRSGSPSAALSPSATPIDAPQTPFPQRPPPDHLRCASSLLRSILSHPALALIPIIIVGNKYDFLPDKAANSPGDDSDWRLASIEELQQHLGLVDILAQDTLPAASHRPVGVGVVSALEGSGVLDVLCWLSLAIKRQRASLPT